MKFTSANGSEMAPGKNRWRGGNNCQRQANKIFTDHTFQIGLKCNYTLQKYNKQVTEVLTVHCNFQKFKCQWGLSEFLGASCPLKLPLHKPHDEYLEYVDEISFVTLVELILIGKFTNLICLINPASITLLPRLESRWFPPYLNGKTLHFGICWCT